VQRFKGFAVTVTVMSLVVAVLVSIELKCRLMLCSVQVVSPVGTLGAGLPWAALTPTPTVRSRDAVSAATVLPRLRNLMGKTSSRLLDGGAVSRGSLEYLPSARGAQNPELA
jgi:hypothetical protein